MVYIYIYIVIIGKWHNRYSAWQMIFTNGQKVVEIFQKVYLIYAGIDVQKMFEYFAHFFIEYLSAEFFAMTRIRLLSPNKPRERQR